MRKALILLLVGTWLVALSEGRAGVAASVTTMAAATHTAALGPPAR
ncbi:MAG: hypothetical protein R2712_14350 [Vicinamibacterales bacterium]